MAQRETPFPLTPTLAGPVVELPMVVAGDGRARAGMSRWLL
jgi:hypothetical protein